jgi:hypothetical protein
MEMREARLAGPFQRFGVHEGEHQDFAGIAMLHDRGQESGGVELRGERTALLPLVAFGIGGRNGAFLSDSCQAEGRQCQFVAR